MEQPNGCRRAAFDRSKDEGVASAEGAPPHGEPSPETAAPAEAAPRRAQTLLDWLGHELRNPIAAIELAVHAMRQLGDERLDQPLSVLERQSRQLGQVVLELVEMTRAMSQAHGSAAALRQAAAAERADPQRVAARDPIPLARGTGSVRRRLLLVEDNQDLSELLRDLLAGWGFDVVTAGSGLAALAKAAARPPDVALIDIGLPDRDGCDVARALRGSLPPSVRLIAMSGFGQRQDGARALSSGFDEFLVKPLNLSQLRALLGEGTRFQLALSGRDP